MSENNNSPLTPALHQLLETCLTLKTTESKILAAHLKRSPATIRTEFQRILTAMHVHSRYCAVITAEERGWLHIEKVKGDI